LYKQEESRAAAVRQINDQFLLFPHLSILRFAASVAAATMQPWMEIAAVSGKRSLLWSGDMGFGEAIRTCFSKYVTFSGRARRPEYWYWVLFGVLVGIAAGILDFAVFSGSKGVFGPLSSLALLLPGIAVTVRRLHDIDRSGWWMLILLLPFIGAVVVFVFMCLRGIAGPNRFGPEPMS
jgi:uncharacterized membrane protein YhaH (DUF805 family)